uniref:Uncharacterized protein n=1 Tax=Avena sativa TaxID=4498 RepID=A0ACD5WNN6_AVESA
MASLSPSPSGRRLSELLKEKQEPFFLDLHLLDKGCSSRLLDGYDYDTAVCWPTAGAGNEAASVLKRLTSKKKKATAAARTRGNNQQQPPAGSGLLRMLLSKILHGKAANRKPNALQCSDSFKRVAPSPSSNLEPVKLIRTDAEELTGDEGTEYSDYDDQKQLSPVSVLEHPFESSPVHSQNKCSNVLQGSPKNAMAIVRELLLEAAYTPALLAHLLAKSDDLIKDTTDLDYDVDDYYYHGTSPKNFHDEDETAAVGNTTTATGAAYWETHRAELAKVSELVCTEVPKSRVNAADVQPERRDVGADIEAAVLEALLLEVVMDISSC